MLKVDKKVLRKKFLKIRENINNNKESEILLNKKILNFFKNLRNNIVAGYISVNHEIDIFDSMTKIGRMDKINGKFYVDGARVVHPVEVFACYL